MKRYFNLLFFILFIISFCLGINANAKEIEIKEPNIIFLRGTGETKDDYPVYEIMDNDKFFMDIYNKSFLKKSIELFGIAYEYSNLDSNDIYFTFRGSVECNAKVGFYIKKDNEFLDKTKSPYIELNSRILRKYNSFNSITQILPHEMGHILQNITTYNNEKLNYNSVDNNYSDIVTEYTTAFSEGFGEHFEVISRMYEENDEIRNNIYKGIEKTKHTTDLIKKGCARDFILPLRIDYYRIIPTLWQGDYEILKRNELGLNGDGKYKNVSHELSDIEQTILYRNMGFGKDKTKLKSLEQSLSTEVVISNFFIKLISTDNDDFYERYRKVFSVFNKYLNKDERPQLIQFVDGYLKEYPHDQERILQIFKDATGHEFTENCAPEIWCLSEKEHITVISDQFCGVKFPYYMFNINTCEKEDLLKLSGITITDAENIISYRDKNSGFKSIAEFSQIENVSDNVIEILKNSTNQEKINEYQNSVEKSSFEKDYLTIFLSNFGHIIYKTLLWFAIFFVICYLVFIGRSFEYRRKVFKVASEKILKLLFYIVMGYMSVVAGSKIVIGNKALNLLITFTIIMIVCEFIAILMLRREKLRIKEKILSSIIIYFIVIYSLY